MLAELQSSMRAGENFPATLALLCDPNDSAYTQSGINAVSVSVYDESSTTPITDLWVSTQPAVSDVIYDTLQTGSGWDLPTGFNFKHVVLPTDLNAAVNGGHVFKLVYTIQSILHGTRIIEHFVTVAA